MKVFFYRRLTAIAVVTFLVVQLLIVIYFWRLDRLSAVSPFGLVKAAFVVVAFRLACSNESRWAAFLAMIGLGSIIHGVIDVP